MSRIARAVVAFLGLAVLGSGLVLPVLGLVLADEPAASCGTKGRCCCAGQRDAVVAGAPPWFEAVLPAASRLARPEPRPLDGSVAPGSPLARPRAPLSPPPKRLLPA